MGLFKRKGKILTGINQQESTAEERYIVNSLLYKYLYTTAGVQFQTNAFNYCPPLQSVIYKLATSLTRGDLIPLVNNEAKDNVEFNKCMKVLSRPNQFQNFDQFLTMAEIMKSVYGVCYIYKVIPTGFNEPTALIIIPNAFIQATYKTVSNVLDPKQGIVDTYYINLYGTTVTLRGEDLKLIHEVRDSAVNTELAYQPQSRINGLEYPIKNICASLESRNQIIVRRGAEVILSPKAGDVAAIMNTMTPAEKELLQKEYSQYGTLGSQWHALIARVPMDATNIGRSVQQLGLFDGENADHRQIASAYGVPVPLLAMPDTSKYSTYGEAKKELYEDAVIPSSKVWASTFDSIFNVKTFKFYFDYSGLECMQKSEKDKADALGAMVKALNEAVSGKLLTEDEAKAQLTDYLN